MTKSARLPSAINEMGDQLRQVLVELKSRSTDLATSSQALITSASTQSSQSSSLDEQVGGAAHAFSRLNSSMDGITSSVEDANTSVATIASAIEEMSASVSEIAQNTARERVIADNARTSVEKSQSAMGEYRSPPSRSAMSSRSSVRSPTRPIYSHSMPRSRPPALASPDQASPSSPTK